MPPFFERQGTAEARHRAPTYRERWVKNDGSGTLGYFGDQRSPGNWAAFFAVQRMNAEKALLRCARMHALK